ncbi:MAG: hypothetical protein KGJ41_07220 [Rhodospirillales bacterium]|nr:hypothetical protein [Rhodospirillales bacterium]MDE2198796.1 hypothetical protein [Rhodospirillales bacterium]MDE2575001.1 hypothetical protein [Rhodospirillales bacterium]
MTQPHKAAFAVVLLLAAAGSGHAADKATFDATLAAAIKADQQAAALHNRWVPTEAALKEAKAAAAGGDFEKATALAKKAQALAERSVQQAEEQKKLWQNAVLR